LDQGRGAQVRPQRQALGNVWHPQDVAEKADEIAVKMLIEVPDSLFEEPQLNVTVTIPDTKLAPILTAEVKKGITDTLATRLGVRVHISAEPAEMRDTRKTSKSFAESLEEMSK
jgi:hypothetical protein